MYEDNIPDEFDLDVRLAESSSTVTKAVGTLYVPGDDETQEGCGDDTLLGCGGETQEGCGGETMLGCDNTIVGCDGETNNPILCGGGETQILGGCAID